MMRSELAKIPDVMMENVSTSKPSYGRFYEFWWSYLVYFPATYFEVRFLSMVQAGLVTFWKQWKFRVDTWNDTMNLARGPEPANVKPLSIDAGKIPRVQNSVRSPVFTNIDPGMGEA
ncbi:unnamed protein product [Orchesella dallaii]|uniref:Uncharacterized protein n=1 Tax=Orchesella dallaii TaxID=48710 RepID=A0ABP1QM29_9HEXA